MSLTLNSFAFSSNGQIHGEYLTVPVENIRHANALYFHQIALIEHLFMLDSLRTSESFYLKHENILLYQSNHKNQEIIENLNLTIKTKDSLYNSLRRQNRILWTCTFLLTSYIIFR